MRWLSIFIVLSTAFCFQCKGKDSTSGSADASEGKVGKTELTGFETPEAAWKTFQKAVTDKDAERIWSFISEKSQKALLEGDQARQMEGLRELPDEALDPMAKSIGKTPAELKSMPLPELARAVMFAEAMKNRENIMGSNIKSVEMKGDSAIVVTIKPDGKEDVVVLSKEHNAWKLDGEMTAKMKMSMNVR